MRLIDWSATKKKYSREDNIITENKAKVKVNVNNQTPRVKRKHKPTIKESKFTKHDLKQLLLI